MSILESAHMVSSHASLTPPPNMRVDIHFSHEKKSTAKSINFMTNKASFDDI